MADYSHIPAPPAPPVADYSHIPAPPAPPSAPTTLDLVAGAADAPRRRRRGVLVGAAAVAVLALVGGVVAVTRGPDPTPSGLAAAAAATEAQKTAHVELTMELPGAAGTTPVTMRGDVDFTGRRSHLTIDLAALSAAAADLPPEMRGLTGIEVISDGLVSYVKLPGLDGLTGGRGMWIKTDAAQMLADSGIDTGGLSAPTGTDPSQMLDLLRAQVGELTTVGTEDVGGVSTTHSRATVDPKDLYARAGAGAADPQQLEAALAAFTGPVVLDVWVDAAGLVRRQTLTVPTTDGDLRLRYELSAFGAPVAITVPAAAETFDLGSLLGHK